MVVAKQFLEDSSIGRIELDTTGVSSESPELKKRLDRISSNYDQLDAVLSELELKISQDERLASPKQKPGESAEQINNDANEVSQAHQTIADSENPRKPR